MSNSKDRTIVIADDHAIVRQGTLLLLSDIPNTRVVAQAADGLSALAAVKKHRPDMLVVDAAMPLARGIEVLSDTRRWSPNTRVILLTGFTSAGILSEWLDAGVEGMLLKSITPEEMKRGFEAVLEGGLFIAADIQDILKRANEVEKLTHREHEVMTLMTTGKTNAEIGDKLSISVKTVEKHRGSLMRKLGVNSVAQLMVYALREGLLEEHKQL